MHTLMQQKISLVAVKHNQMSFQFGAISLAQILEQDVLPELQSDDGSFRMIFNKKHGVAMNSKDRLDASYFCES